NAATPTVGPFPTCGPGSDYVIVQSTGASIVPGGNDIGNHTDDGVTAVNLPFPVQLYGASYNAANVSSNGNIQFNSSANAYANACLPAAGLDGAIMAYWDDLRTDQVGAGCSAFTGGCGIFISTTGTAPNRVFNIEWRAVYYNSPNSALDFEVRLYEGQD